MMLISGERMKRKRLIQSEKYVVAVEAEMVVPEDDPSEPCYESETIQFLQEVKSHADSEDLEWLSKHRKVYAAIELA